MISYKEEDLLGGWSIAVLVSGVPVGHICKHGFDGSFVYFQGPSNQLNWSMQDRDLLSLKGKIEATLT
jgi:hypothetical protein